MVGSLGDKEFRKRILFSDLGQLMMKEKTPISGPTVKMIRKHEGYMPVCTSDPASEVHPGRKTIFLGNYFFKIQNYKFGKDL